MSNSNSLGARKSITKWQNTRQRSARYARHFIMDRSNSSTTTTARRLFTISINCIGFTSKTFKSLLDVSTIGAGSLVSLILFYDDEKLLINAGAVISREIILKRVNFPSTCLLQWYLIHKKKRRKSFDSTKRPKFHLVISDGNVHVGMTMRSFS